MRVIMFAVVMIESQPMGPRRGRRRKVEGSRAIGYVRVSTEEQENGPAAQRDAITAWAEKHKVDVVAWCEDIGISGGAPADERPGLMTALEELRTRRAGLLLVAKRDRLARDTVLAALIERHVQGDGAKVASADGAGNGEGPEAELLKAMIDAFAQYERALIRMRTKAALAAKKKRGERVGQVPYGSQMRGDGCLLEPSAAEQAVILEIQDLRRAGLAIHAIVARLNAAGRPARGKRWHPTTVSRILAAHGPTRAGGRV